MKKYIVISLFSAALMFASCSKLDVSPKDEITDKEAAYKSPAIVKQILAGVYSTLLHEGTWGALISIRNEASTDITITRMAAVDSPENNSHTTQSAQIHETWTKLFQGINAANEFIYYSDLYTPDSPTRTQMVAEARFLRAYYYFTLVRLFGDVPFRTDPSTDLNKTDIARTSAVEIYDFIIKDIEKSELVLGMPKAVSYGSIAKTAAQAALADVYLNLGGALMKNRLPADSTVQLMHQRSAYWSNKVLVNPEHNITKTAYETIFMNQVRNVQNINEQVWELQPKYQIENGFRSDTRLGKYNGMGAVKMTSIYQAGANVYHGVAIRKYYKKIDANDGDERMDWNCPTTKLGIKTTLENPDYVPVDAKNENIYQLFAGKWRTIFATTKSESTNINYSGARLSMYRIADLHLMYAEAMNEGYNNQQTAMDHINIVRTRAKATTINNVPSKDEVFQIIVDERARELCFEGKRRFDLIRWDIYGDVIHKAEAEYNNTSWVKGEMMAGFKNYDASRHSIYPIPQNEIGRNALIPPSEQNKGWGGNRAWR